MNRRRFYIAILLVATFGLLVLVYIESTKPRPGKVLDEARQAGRDVASFHAADEDYFHDMDGAEPLTADEIKGRNMWIVWTGGNDRFWDAISIKSFGALDFLKTLSSI